MHPRFTSRRSSAAALLLLLSIAFVCPAPSRAADPTVKLDALVTEVTSRHPELAFYEAEIAAAKAGARSAAAWADPELSLSAGHKRVRDFSSALAGEGTAWSVSLTQTFEWPGRLAIRQALANGQIALAELGLARFRTALESRARTLAYSLHAAHTRAATVREVADRFTALKETFLAREPAGLTPLLETRVIEAAELSLQRRAAEAGLSDRCRFILHDYRNEEGRFDRVVSVGMYEHVGLRHGQAFFRQVSKLLAEDGVALIHTITKFRDPGPIPTWTSKYVFPGAYVPTLSEMTPAIEKSGLYFSDIETLRIHYAETLRHWRERLYAHKNDVEKMYDARFFRMWDFYLTGSEVAFRQGELMITQIQIEKRLGTVPLTRSYLHT